MKKIATIFAGSLFLFFVFLSCACAGDSVELSCSFLGAYTKTTRFYPQLEKYSQNYRVNLTMVLAIAMYESGGNDNLVSSAGAGGLMQVMPATAKSMKTENDTEAGVKYLRYLENTLVPYLKSKDGDVSLPKLNSFIVMGYNAGPGGVKSKKIVIETYQYLQGVSLYYNLLSQNRKSIEEAASRMSVLELKESTTWADLSIALGVSELELRLYNPFAAHRLTKTLSAGWAISFPLDSVGFSFETLLSDGDPPRHFYTIKHGDILHHLANSFGFSYNEMRDKCGLLIWGALQPGTRVEITGSKYLN